MGRANQGVTFHRDAFMLRAPLFDPYFYAGEALRLLYSRLGLEATAAPPVCPDCGGAHWPEGDPRGEADDYQITYQ